MPRRQVQAGIASAQELGMHVELLDAVLVKTVVRGGFADTIQSIAITEAGVVNHANSGQGTMLQRVTFAAVTLANSDLLKVELITNVGSNTI